MALNRATARYLAVALGAKAVAERLGVTGVGGQVCW